MLGAAFMAIGTVDTELQLGDFKLLRKLGEGAAGAVYHARQISFDRDAAVKVLYKTSSKQIARFYREARLAGSLDHPHIVQGYAVGEDRGLHYFAMEYIDGHSLQYLLDKLRRLKLPAALRVTLAVARALDYAHGQNLVHRDIKPGNVLIGRKGAIKVADLGMAKIRDVDLAELTRTGRGLGTPCYMPLEQFVNAKDASARCDIYALGCMLYALLTGQPPFLSSSFMELIQAKEAGTFPPAREFNPEVPECLDVVIARMAARRPEDRFQTCRDVIDALLELGLDRSQSKNAPTSKRVSGKSTMKVATSTAPCAEPPPQAEPAVQPQESSRPPARQTPSIWSTLAWVALGVGAVTLVVLVVLHFLLGW
jgi:eukaryotic-like serine/threonine-protein kinase